MTLLAAIDSNAILATGAMVIACAVLSVLVVARRWALLGEGIGHAGFGGAGTAWLLAVMAPGVFNNDTAPYVLVIVFCFLAAVLIGWVSSNERVSSDAAIGIFLVASLAWGFVGRQVYFQHFKAIPFGFDNLLFGQITAISSTYTVAAVAVAFAVVAGVWTFGKELIAYSFDPLMARTSGVRVGLVHNLLLLLIALTIVTGTRIVGTVLVTALLVLPAATANLLSSRLRNVFVISITVALIGAIVALVVNHLWHAIPAGPVIVLTMFVLFLASLVVTRVKKTSVQSG